MNLTANTTRIELDFEKLAKLHANGVAAAIGDSVASWLASWNGPVQIDARDVNLSIDAGLAFACARPAKW